jgi:DNA-binding transcriptional ArsR family regulator
MSDVPLPDPPRPGASRRPPTAAEARALGHPLRMRILFACRDRGRTNKELADALRSTPGTIHYHLKRLVEQGFLRPEEARPGPRGSTEQPYRATGKSWQLRGTPEGARTLLQVGADEASAAHQDDVLGLTRLGLTLARDDLDELVRRLDELVDEFFGRSRTRADGDPAGANDEELESVALFVALHRTHEGGAGRGAAPAG